MHFESLKKKGAQRPSTSPELTPSPSHLSSARPTCTPSRDPHRAVFARWGESALFQAHVEAFNHPESPAVWSEATCVWMCWVSSEPDLHGELPVPGAY